MELLFCDAFARRRVLMECLGGGVENGVRCGCGSGWC